MATTKERIPLAEAQSLAAEVTEILRPSCERIEIAGSIRRQAPDCGDIEIVAAPRFRDDGPGDLFGMVPGMVNLLDERCDQLLAVQTFAPRLDVNGHRAIGSKYKRLLYHDFALDLFAVIEPAQWGVIYTLRTGPADYSHRLVTSTYVGGLLPPWIKVRDGALWCGPMFLELAPTPEEEDFYRALNLDYVQPEARR